MPQKFVNLENLTSFWGNAKEYIGNERKEIENQLYNWQKTEKALIVQCEPVPNSELHSVVNFSFTETLPAEGEKGPDNSSTITGISSVKVTRCGKNLLPISQNSSSVINGITFTNNGDGTITVNGTASDLARYYIVTSGSNIKYRPGMSYTLSGCPAGGSSNGFYLIDGSINAIDDGNGKTFEPSTELLVSIYIRINSGTTVSNLVFKPQLELGSTATSFEPYSGVSATVNLGETRYGGSIDLSTGLMTIEWKSEIISSLREFSGTSSDYVRFRFSNSYYPRSIVTEKPFASNILEITYSDDWYEHMRPNVQGAASCGITMLKSRLDMSGAIDPSNPTNAEWLAAGNAYFSSHPFQFLHKTAPYTIQLTPQQIKSLPSLEGTSKRINTIYTDADSVQVEYQKYVGIDSTLDSDSVNAIQNKVVNSALNTKVSLSGDETINGTKTFSNTINGSITGDAGTVAGHIVSKDVPVNAAFTDTTYDPATQSTAGLMSASDKVKLDAVGSVFSFKGSVANSSSLPASNNTNGDAYLAEDTGHVHVYNGSSFVDIGIWAGIPSATDAQIDALFED